MVVIENAIVRKYGEYVVLNCSAADYSINPDDNEYKYLRNLPPDDSVVVDMSPRKQPPKAVERVGELSDTQGRHIVCASPTAIVPGIYYQCPLVGCRKSMQKMDHFYTCTKCNKRYTVSATGVRLSVTICTDSENIDVVMFNDIATKFLNTSRTVIEKETGSDLLCKVAGRMFKFEVQNQNKMENFLCTNVECIDDGNVQQSQPEKMKYASKKTTTMNYVEDSKDFTGHCDRPVIYPQTGSTGEKMPIIPLEPIFDEALDLSSPTNLLSPGYSYSSFSSQFSSCDDNPVDFTIKRGVNSEKEHESVAKKLKFGINDILSLDNCQQGKD